MIYMDSSIRLINNNMFSRPNSRIPTNQTRFIYYPKFVGVVFVHFFFYIFLGTYFNFKTQIF